MHIYIYIPINGIASLSCYPKTPRNADAAFHVLPLGKPGGFTRGYCSVALTSVTSWHFPKAHSNKSDSSKVPTMMMLTIMLTTMLTMTLSTHDVDTY